MTDATRGGAIQTIVAVASYLASIVVIISGGLCGRAAWLMHNGASAMFVRSVGGESVSEAFFQACANYSHGSATQALAFGVALVGLGLHMLFSAFAHDVALSTGRTTNAT